MHNGKSIHRRHGKSGPFLQISKIQFRLHWQAKQMVTPNAELIRMKKDGTKRMGCLGVGLNATSNTEIYAEYIWILHL